MPVKLLHSIPSETPSQGATSKVKTSLTEGGKQNQERIFDIDCDVLFTAEQLAAKLNVKVKTIRKWRYEGTLPPETMLKVGRHLVRYRLGKVLEWLNASRSVNEHSPN